MAVMDLWHGTNEDFALAGEVFDTSGSIGVHFGSREAASSRLAMTGRVAHDDGRAAVPQQFQVSIECPLRMPDLGSWAFPSVLRELRAESVLTAAQVDDAYTAWNVSDAAGWSALKAGVRAAGYDGIVYVNQVEHAGCDSWIAFEAEQIMAVAHVERERG